MLAATLLLDCSDTPGGGASSRPVAAALSVRVAGAASPHGGTDTLRTAAAVPRLTRLAAMPRPARHTCPGRDGMPFSAAHSSHCGGAMSTEQADLSNYDPTQSYS